MLDHVLRGLGDWSAEAAHRMQQAIAAYLQDAQLSGAERSSFL